MELQEWQELRRTLDRKVDRSKIECNLRELYKVMGWDQFYNVIFCEDPSMFRWDIESTYYSYRYGRRGVQLMERLEQLGPFTVGGRHDPFQGVYFDFRILDRQFHNDRVMQTLAPLVRDCLEISPRPHRPLVLLKPLELHFNADGRLHNTDGPSVVWRSGREWYHFQGVQCSRKFIMEEPTLGYINRERNTERRRLLIERYGEERYLRAKNAKLVKEDEYGKLWEWRDNTESWRFDHMARMVEVVNSPRSPEPDGTLRKFFERVPPNIQSPKEAIAWQFGIDKGDYKVIEET